MSIVVAVRNSLQLLQEGLDSWLESLPEDVDLILVDGGSTDGSREWLAARDSAHQGGALTYIVKNDSSIAEAWNNAVGIANGEWLLFMGADDRIPDGTRWQGVIRRLAFHAAAVDACLFPVQIISAAGRHLDEVAPNLVDDGTIGCGIARLPHQGVFHRRSMWRRFGEFDTTYAVAADYEFLVRARAGGACFEVCGEVSPVQMTFGGMSTRSPLATLREYRRIHRAYGVRGSRIRWGLKLAAAATREALAAAGLRWLADTVGDFARVARGRPKVWTVP